MKLVFLQQQFLPRLFLKAYHGRTSCFILYWSNMQYTKQAMDFYCQLDILKERGLTIEDEEDAIKFLHSVSYFRFANYLQPMELNTESHRFAQNSSFTFATNWYVFDRELRSLIFTAIQDIEIAFRTRIIHYFSMEHGPFWFMDASKFKNQSIFNNCFATSKTTLSRRRWQKSFYFHNIYI